MNPVCWFDITLSWSEEHKKNLLEWSEQNCRKWSISREIGETGYDHLQGRVVMNHKTRLTTLIANTPETLKEWHLSITSSKCIGKLDPMSYVEKTDTHIDGPWTSKDCQIPDDMRDPTLRLWQENLLKTLDTKPDSRTIMIAQDSTGNKGKSWMARYLLTYRDVMVCPFFGDVNMLANGIGSAAPKRIYLFDIPRAAVNKNRWREIVTFAETLKNGIVTEMRYKFRQTLIDIPHVVIFCNFTLDPTWLSPDRWKHIDLDPLPDETLKEALTL